VHIGRVIAIAGLLLVGACTDDGSTTGTITGTLRVAGGPPPGFDDPTSGVVTIEREGRVRERIHVPATGRFFVELEPGNYELIGRLTGPTDPCGPEAPSPPDETVDLRSNATETVRLTCAVG
jgi:hypothetical protein